MIKILANDGIHPDGKLLLEEANYQVDTDHIPQDQLADRLPEYDGVIVRSVTKIRKDLIDRCPKLRLIARAGVGMDNIDVAYAEGKGIKVINTPKASSRAVAELVIGQVFTLARSLHLSNREMPVKGGAEFKKLKSKYSEGGSEVFGKTIGIIGLGRIGQEVARIAMGMGMRVLATDTADREVDLRIQINGFTSLAVLAHLKTTSMERVLTESDYITVHVSGDKPLIGTAEFAKMKQGAFVINTSRGGVISEEALLTALNSGKLAGAALDVFENEVSPRAEILAHPLVSLTPHIGASTLEAQRYIGLELADAFIEFFGTEQ